MTPINSDTPVDELVAVFLKYQNLEIEASEREDTRGANRHFEKLYAAVKQLAKTSPGRDALELLMHHEIAEIRLRAAGQVIAWAPETAIPVLGRLLVSWRPKDPRKGYVGVRTTAKARLYTHFGINGHNRNDLIEPLRRYGIELPRLPDEIWT